MIAVFEAWLADVPWTSVLTLFVDLTIKSVLICGVAAVVTLLLRRSTAFVRCTVWACALAGLLLLPAFSTVSPAWNVPIIPDLASLSVGSYVPETDKPEPGSSPAQRTAQVEARDLAAGASGTTPGGIPWHGWVILLWVAGGLFCLCWNLISHAGVRSVVRNAISADPKWTGLLDSMAKDLGITRKVRLLESGHLKAAITVGIVDPVIVLPSDCDEWPASRRRFVLLHELAHVQRWDTLTETFALLTTVVYWCNPVVWYAVRRLRIERETDCDNAVLRTGAKPSEYAELLLKIAADVSASTNPVWQLSTISQGSNVKDRLMDILNQKVNRTGGSRRSAIVTGVLALSLVLPISTSNLWSDATSQTKDKAKQEKKAADEKKKAEWNSMSDEEKAKMKAEKKAKWDAMSSEEKSDQMWKAACKSENSAACLVGTEIKKQGVKAGIHKFKELKSAGDGEFVFKEKEFNSLGYAFLYLEKTDEAIAVFKLNVKQYPESWNCYDSLGEAYMVAKKYDESLKYYEIAVNKNPESEHSKQQIEKLRTMIAERN
jgi:beta-lactamase regulating signal transducer with metallopeptidase domain